MSASLEARLAKIQLPGASGTLEDLDWLRRATVDVDGKAQVVIALPSSETANAELWLDALQKEVASVEGVNAVSVRAIQLPPERAKSEGDLVAEARNIILVMSGKGGVGKSTVCTNLAMSLSRLGYRVGLLDADLYGPSIPTMFGVSGRPMSDGKNIRPLERAGIKLMSMGFLLEDEKAAVVWRGPMLHSALVQFLGEVSWGKLDFLLLDMPPGTGDIALTLAQKARATGSVMVTTPQEVALQDVYKSLSMNKKVGIPTLGIVENESYFLCGNCSEKHEIFGSGGGQKAADFAGAPLLGQIPIEPAVRIWGDSGTPIVDALPSNPAARAMADIAEALIQRLIAVAESAPAPLQIDRSGGTRRHLPIS